MSPAQTEFAHLMQRVRAGCSEAAQEVFHRYSDHIRPVVRRRLHQRLRAQLDSTDFLQSVWASFFHDRDRYVFRTAEHLIAFLATLAHNKVVDFFRRSLQTERHNLNREQRLNFAADSSGQDQSEFAVKQPTPSQVAIAQESWERLIAHQPVENRQALDMLRQGFSHKEIADRLGLHPKRLQRLLQRLTRKVSSP